MKKEKFKSSIGGQALIEGVYMRGPEKGCLAVRQPDGEIYVESEPTSLPPLRKIPIVRGAASMVDSLVKGYKSIMKSADIALADEVEVESKFNKWLSDKLGDNAFSVVGTIGAVLGGVLSIVLFLVVPTLLTGLIDRFLPLGGWKAAVEGVLKILIFISYLALVTRMKDIHRVFEYHGAEHKTVACYEAEDELTVENVRKYSRFHPRCGTSFIFLILIVSIVIFSFVPFENTWLRAGVKLLLIPVIMGISYEILRYVGRHSNWFARALATPGMWVQRLTTFEPDDDQIEVAIAALTEVIPEGGEKVA